MDSYLTPMLLIIGTAAANSWYNTGGTVDLKIPVAGAVATGILGILSNIPGLEPVLANIAWIAFIAVVISPVQSPSPLANIQKITGF